MKLIDGTRLEALPGIRIKGNQTFQFHCHTDIACFNRCCRNLNLFLYPYDVIRLKTRLGLSSERFVDEYVHVILRNGNFFPDVLLQMSDTDEKTCPFLAESGCLVYPDRPDTCRTFPIEQGRRYRSGARKGETVHFFRPPDFCLGRHEKKEWTVNTWIKDQEAETYNEMTARWAELKMLFRKNPWGGEGADGRRGKMAFMATYNIDPFREFIFNSTFLKRYKVKSALLKKIKADDIRLMIFGFEWVELFVWGKPSKNIRRRN